MGKSALIQLPVMEVYERRTPEDKEFIKATAVNLASMFKDAGYEVIAITENELATFIFGSKSDIVSYYSGVSRADFMFLQKYAVSSNSGVVSREIPYKPIDIEIIKKAEKRHKVASREIFPDDNQYLINRINTVVRRASTAGGEFINHVTGIAYCSFKDNNFFRLPKYEVGSGKIILEADLKAKSITYSFGGVYVNEESILKVMESI